MLEGRKLDMGHARALLALEQTLQAQAARQIGGPGKPIIVHGFPPRRKPLEFW